MTELDEFAQELSGYVRERFSGGKDSVKQKRKDDVVEKFRLFLESLPDRRPEEMAALMKGMDAMVERGGGEFPPDKAKKDGDS